MNVPVCCSAGTDWEGLGWAGTAMPLRQRSERLAFGQAQHHQQPQRSEPRPSSGGRGTAQERCQSGSDSGLTHRDSPRSRGPWLLWRCVRFPTQATDGTVFHAGGMSCHFFWLPKPL